MNFLSLSKSSATFSILSCDNASDVKIQARNGNDEALTAAQEVVGSYRFGLLNLVNSVLVRFHS